MPVSFSWLHLTDLHLGLSLQHWLWPNVRQLFLEDLERVHHFSGPWDFLLFSGDLVQSGEDKQFQKLTEVLAELWDHFEQLGSSPILLATPGNHDLLRPDPLLPEVVALQNWHEMPKLRD